LFSFPPVTEMFHFAGFRSSHPIDSGAGNLVFRQTGFSHSDISGSQPICGSPKLFAAYHVLLRHSMPGHSPCALSNLTKLKSRCLSRCYFLYTLSMQFSKNCGLVSPSGPPVPKASFNKTNWWAHQDSNLGPRPYQGRALTN
jgi:hypothetical protein